MKHKLSLSDNISLDSLKLRIPLIQVSLKDKELFNHMLHVNEGTGEIEDYKRKAKEYTISDSVKVRIGVQNVVTSKGIHTEQLIVLLNTKILGSRYFEGFTKDNIDLVYNELMALGAFWISKQEFLSSSCTDIDFKFDQRMKWNDYKKTIQDFKDATKKTALSSGGYKPYTPTKDNPLNYGLQFGGKRDNATMSKPFFKIYNKTGEFTGKTNKNSNEFCSEYFSNVDISDVVRLETTIKNKRHAELLGIKDVTINGLLSLTEKEKIIAFRKILAKHLDIEVKKINKPMNDNLSPEQLINYNCLMYLMQSTNFDAQTIIEEIMLSNVSDKVSKHRKKKSLMSLYENYIKGNKEDLRTQNINVFFKRLTWS